MGRVDNVAALPKCDFEWPLVKPPVEGFNKAILPRPRLLVDKVALKKELDEAMETREQRLAQRVIGTGDVMSQTDDMEVDDPPLFNIVEREARMDVDPFPPLPKDMPEVREGPLPQRAHTQPQRHPPPAPEPSGPQRAHTHKQPSGALLGTNVPKIQVHIATYSMNLHVGLLACEEDEEYDTGAASRPPP